jgi:nanoRNase/pAp phosphatase (c-di-AMP/oligoRNAs hydrolase)
LPNGEKKLSFRSKQGHYDVNALAAHFWWGGHAAAAGARTRLETREILRMIEKIEVPNKTLS